MNKKFNLALSAHVVMWFKIQESLGSENWEQLLRSCPKKIHFNIKIRGFGDKNEIELLVRKKKEKKDFEHL